MDGVNSVRTSYGTTLNAPGSAEKALPGKADSGSTSNVQGQAPTGNADTAKLSSLAQLLSDAATRAAARDASTDRQSLAAIASRTADALYGPDFDNAKPARDAQVPDSQDPQRLQQARQATEFLNEKGANPFKGLSLEQLTLIAYDEGDSFTVNERRAALMAAGQEREAWEKAVVKQLMDEYNRSGHFSPDTLRGILDYYKDLPAILEAGIVGDYESNLNKQIKTAEREEAQSKDQLQSLLDLVLARQQDSKHKAAATDA